MLKARVRVRVRVRVKQTTLYFAKLSKQVCILLLEYIINIAQSAIKREWVYKTNYQTANQRVVLLCIFPMIFPEPHDSSHRGSWALTTRLPYPPKKKCFAPKNIRITLYIKKHTATMLTNNLYIDHTAKRSKIWSNNVHAILKSNKQTAYNENGQKIMNMINNEQRPWSSWKPIMTDFENGGQASKLHGHTHSTSNTRYWPANINIQGARVTKKSNPRFEYKFKRIKTERIGKLYTVWRSTGI